MLASPTDPARATAVPMLLRLREKDIARCRALEAEVLPAVPAGYVRQRPAAAWTACAQGEQGAGWYVEAQGRVVAVGLLRLATEPAAGAPHFPRLSPQDWRHACIVENALVHPAYRGMGLHRMMLRARLEHARARGLRWAVGGTRLANVASWGNMLHCGFMLVGLRSDAPQAVVGLLAPLDGRRGTRPDFAMQVEAADVAGHLAALSEGFAGVRFSEGFVSYERWCAPDPVDTAG